MPSYVEDDVQLDKIPIAILDHLTCYANLQVTAALLTLAAISAHDYAANIVV